MKNVAEPPAAAEARHVHGAGTDSLSLGDVEIAGHGRRELLGTAVKGIAAAGIAGVLPADRSAAATGEAVRPFRIDIPEAELADLRRRLAATRFPDKETVGDDSQGVPLATLQVLVRHWQTDYDWRKIEAREQPEIFSAELRAAFRPLRQPG